jgi:putative iron-only hydrogenase system regulator
LGFPIETKVVITHRKILYFRTFLIVVETFFVGKTKEVFMLEENKNQNARIAVISIIVSDRRETDKLNALLSEYGEYILGRMGIPYKEKNVSVLSVVLDAPMEITNALTGKLGRLEGVTVKALFGKL